MTLLDATLSTSVLSLPQADGSLAPYRLSGKALPFEAPAAPFTRVVFSAAHVVADPLATVEPAKAVAIDWEATLAYRRHLAGLGLGIAEAMDTAQRGMGLPWPAALELIGRSVAELRGVPGASVFSGVGTDHVDPADIRDIDGVVAAYLHQLEAVQKLGGRVILMASRALARVARGAGDYETVYRRVLTAADAPVILHWLGEAFDPALAGYWGAATFEDALETVVGIIGASVSKVDGIKISLLDDQAEIALRRRLPDGVKMYTGDDFNYPALIKGDERGHSHALLGIFDAIAPAASLALSALARGDEAGYDRLMAPTVPLSRCIFRAPTYAYKTGIVFLAWLNGFQSHFTMLGGAQAQRSIGYFAEVFRLADGAGLLRDPDLAATRMRALLALHGVDAR